MKKTNQLFIKIVLIFIAVLWIKVMFSNESYALTQQEYKTKIESILATWENKKFNDSTYYDGHNSFYNCTKCGKGAWECLAFSRYVLNQFYGCCDCCGNLTSLYTDSINSVKDIRVGDGLRYNGGAGYNHSIIIIDTDQVGNTVQILECNRIYDTHLVTQRTEPFSEIKNWLNGYLVNRDGESGRAYLIRSPGNSVLTIKGDYEAPAVQNYILNAKSATTNSMDARIWATDNVGIRDVGIRIWQSGKDPSTGKVKTLTSKNSDGYYNATFTTSEVTKGTTVQPGSLVCVRFCVTDTSGNQTIKELDDMAFAGKTDLGNFTARIVPKSNTNFAVGLSSTEKDNLGNNFLKLKTKNLSDTTQIWKFEKQSDGSYKIMNLFRSGKVIHANGGENAIANGVLLKLYDYNSSAPQQHYILQSYNGGYRIVPLHTGDVKALDIKDGSIKDEQSIELYQTYSWTNAAQTFIFEKVATGMTLNRSSLSLNEGNTQALTATITPTDVATKNVTWSSSNTSVATVSSSGVVTAKGIGSAIITARTTDGTNISRTCSVTVTVKTPSVNYTTHVQNIGWQAYVKDGAMAGTSGKSLRLEGIKIKLTNTPVAGGIQYRTHVQNIGWQDWVSNDMMAGTSGRSLRLEAIQIKLTGEMVNKYDIYYRVHAQEFGWLGWAKNGASAGTQGHSYRLEAIEIKLVAKGKTGPTSTVAAFYNGNLVPSVNYTSHVQNIGWQSYAKDGAMSGTSGKSYRIEGIKIKLTNMPAPGGIQYRTHVQNIGWQSWVQNDTMAGTSGKSLRLEAIQLKLTGKMAEKYDIYYRVHAQEFGWLGWAKNGASAGTQGYSYRLEGIQIKLVKKGSAVPGSTANAFKSK